VTQVRRDTPAMAAGLNVDDEILAIDDFRVRADRLDNRLEQYRPGDKVQLLVARRERLLRLDVTFGTEPARAWRLEVNPSANDTQQSSRDRWLNAGPPASGKPA
jgi:predicted metalloprotease with PDZ domain